MPIEKIVNGSASDVKIDDREWEEAEKAAKESVPQLTVRLTRPFEWEGKTYEKLAFDFDKLTGRDSLEIEHEMRALNLPLITPAFSGDYILRVAARACEEEIGTDMLLALPLRSYNQVRTSVSAFLLRSEI